MYTYSGKTITSLLSQRVNGHRRQYYELIGDNIDVNIDPFDDDDILGAHIIRKHKKTEKSDFDNIFIFDILWIDQPKNLRKYEQSLTNKLKTLYPFGLHNINSTTVGVGYTEAKNENFSQSCLASFFG